MKQFVMLSCLFSSVDMLRYAHQFHCFVMFVHLFTVERKMYLSSTAAYLPEGSMCTHLERTALYILLTSKPTPLKVISTCQGKGKAQVGVGGQVAVRSSAAFTIRT